VTGTLKGQIGSKGHDSQNVSLHHVPVLAAGPAPLSSCNQISKASPGHGKWPRQQKPGHQTSPVHLACLQVRFLGMVSPSYSNLPSSPSCASSSKLGPPSLLAPGIDCFCSPQALVLSTAQPSCAMLQCQPGPALQRAPTPQQLIPAPTAQGRAACLDAVVGRSIDGNGRKHWLISDPPVATGICYLMSPATLHSRQLSSFAPFCYTACHPKGRGTLGTPTTPEQGEWLPAP